MSQKWMRLDNAALIFPAIRQRRWVNVFRVSTTLTEPVDPVVLQQAVYGLGVLSGGLSHALCGSSGGRRKVVADASRP